MPVTLDRPEAGAGLAPSPVVQTPDAISSVAVTAHAACALLLALTFGYLSRLLGRTYLRRWALSWAFLLLAILSVRCFIAFGGRGFWVVYLVAEWSFLAALLVGCRELARGGQAPLSRFLVPGLLAGVILAGTLVPFFTDFNLLFSFQAAVLAAGFAAAFVALGRAPAERHTLGFHLMRAALGWLAVQFLLYVPLYLIEGLHRQDGERLHFAWLSYSSLADLCGQLLLGFGMLFIPAEENQRELAQAVGELRAARDQLAEQVYIDALTGARNRRAFQALLESAAGLPGGGRGTLAMIDLDHLKEINDTAGHSAGDAAIRAAAGAIRRLLRDSDLLFRWGGDEFLALLPGCGQAEAEALLAPLGAGAPFDPWPDGPAGGDGRDGCEGRDGREGRERRDWPSRHLHLTWGTAELQGSVTAAAIDDAIARADQAMYGVRAATRPTPG
ncbi:MAG TPA: GGDEF domain-containing protein [Thermoanaerobaculia bacterium]|jgi:GGDEF domain-containing protein|nr:GGDEF domain-containing protein [Thermoanaerobaculia bacterium]